MIPSIILTLSYLLRIISGYNLKPVTDPVQHAECPIWDPRTNHLYFVDLLQGGVLCYNYNTGITHRIYRVPNNGTVAPVLLHTDRTRLILGVNRSITDLHYDPDTDQYQARDVLLLPTVPITSRTNDGKTDNRGRIWIGTMGLEDLDGNVQPDEGALFRISGNFGQTDIVLKPVSISNGMAWNRANTKFYYIDSTTRQIVGFDYDSESGTLKLDSRQVVYDLNASNETIEGVADGMTIDRQDNLWIAVYGDATVLHVDPIQRILLSTVRMPVKYVTSVAWGGPQFDILYVTTSKARLTGNNTGWAGSVFAVTDLNASGWPIFFIH